MGQSASSHRGNDGNPNRRSRDFSQLLPDHEPQPELEDTSLNAERTIRRQHSSSSAGLSSSSRRLTSSQSTQSFANIRRHVLPQSGTSARGNTVHDEILYEQEERLLTGTDDVRVSQAARAHTATAPIARRSSVASRLGGRLFSRSSPHGRLGGETEAGEHPRRLLRRRRDNRAARSVEDAEASDERLRHSMMGSLPYDFPRLTRQRRSTHRVSDAPTPLLEDHTEASESGGDVSLRENPPSSTRRRLFQTPSEANRRSRMESLRRSISSPLELFTSNSSSNQSTVDRQGSNVNRRPVGIATADETDYLLPPLNVADTNIDLDDSLSAHPEQHEARHPENSPTTAEPAELPAWNQRWADRTSSVRRETRRVPNLLRGRSSRIIRRDDEAPLSRILQLAAAAIAAQLSGNPDSITHMQPVTDDGLDGSLNTFMETLNSATNGTTTSTGEDARALSTLPPLNFLRVFRFVNGQSERRPSLPPHSRQEPARIIPASETEASEAAADGRTVTLVVVGVRSVPSASINRDGTDSAEPNLDALLSLPLGSMAPAPSPLRSATGGLLRYANGRSRFTHRRRASMGGLNTFPANYDSQRHQRMHSSSRPVSGESTPVASTSIPLVLSESPPGPHPPPSTPADPYRSAQASAATTPSRRPSSASAAQPPIFSARDSHDLHTPGSSSAIELDATQAPRQRRRSDSEFARHRDLGAGAARRNGVVEPDHVPTSGRSWLIYVVGTNLSEDHPAFATPSLFTDNPTYEDMLLLSSLLGPAKPPVASREDVASALGVYRVQRDDEFLVAVALEGNVRMHIQSGERCLVCLCDYELGEEVRMLNKCSHMFHRDCIDVWLTTGRNSCPLCRGLGVDEKAGSASNSVPASPV